MHEKLNGIFFAHEIEIDVSPACMWHYWMITDKKYFPQG
jgi:hypothetical protein